MDQDEALIEVLEEVTRQPFTEEADLRLEKAMKLHDEFSQGYQKFYIGGSLPLDPSFQRSNLLDVARERGARSAIEWYRKVIHSVDAEIRVWGRVKGLNVKFPLVLPNGVNIVPAIYAPKNRRFSVLSDSSSIYKNIDLSSYAVLSIGRSQFGDFQENQTIFLSKCEIIKETVEAFCLDGKSGPTVIESWSDFQDPDLERAQVGIMSRMNDTEGPAPRLFGNSPEEALPWVEKYLKLPAEVRARYRLPISRLNMATRNFTPGNKAIDGSICLDAICGKNVSRDIGHHLAELSAKFLGNSDEEKNEIYCDLRKFYTLRNETIHPTKQKKIGDPEAVANRGLEICVQLLRGLIKYGKVPETEKWGTQEPEAPWDFNPWQAPAKY